MITRPVSIGAFEFAVVSGLRAIQLHRGCTPRVSPSGKQIVTAQHEVAERKIARVVDIEDGASGAEETQK